MPGDDWSLTLTLRAPADPTATFNFFLEECTETTGTTGCTPQATRQWVDWVAVDGPTLPGTAITPVTLSDGQSFTWANLDADRHYRMIEVGTASPPDTGTGSAPAGWAVTGFACESVGATLLESDDNSFVGFLSTVDEELVPGPGWSDCTVANSQIAEVRAGSTITAHKVGDRSAIRTNQPLQGATMGLWRDLNGDGNFQPGGADGAAFMTCVTAANGACDFTGLAEGAYWVQEVSPPAGGVWNAITEWGPGSSSAANPAVPYAAVRNGDPAATLSVPGPDYTNGFPIIVDGRTSDSEDTDDFANRRTNPSIGDVTCQALFRIVLVLDRSGSIQRTARLPTRTPSPASSTTSWAPTPTSGSCPSRRAPRSRRATPASSAAHRRSLTNAINSVYNNTGGGTNWDAGLFAVDGPFNPAPDLVVMVTDGNPTLNNTTSTSAIRGELGRLHAGRDLLQPAQEQLTPGSSPWLPERRVPSPFPASSASVVH